MNDDLISRQAAIDALLHNQEVYANHFGNDPIDKYTIALIDNDAQTIAQLPSAQPEQRWIPVSERLPEANGRYLVTRGLNACGAMWNRVYLINYSDLMGLKSERIWWDGNVGKSDFERIDDVTAWMPLPKPYKEENDE